MAGLTAQGFSIKTLETLISELETELKGTINAGLNTSTDTPFGHVLRIFASKLSELWDLGQAVYGSQYPDSAFGQSLAFLASLTGTIRRAETFSTVLATVDLDADTYASGDLIASVDGDPTARFENRDEIVAPGGEIEDVVFVAQSAGPVRADAGTLTVIAETVTGWNSITNPEDATLGALEEADTPLRLRREDELNRAGSTTARAVRAAVLAVDGVTACTVLENDTDATVSGMPPHSLQAVVLGGDDQAIAEAIEGEKAGGIQAFGSEGPFTVIDSQGESHSIDFSRPAVQEINIEVTLQAFAAATGTFAAYVGDTATKQAIADWGDANLTSGLDVLRFRIGTIVGALPGVYNVTQVRLSINPAALANADVAITNVQIAEFDTSRITLIVSEPTL